VAVNASEAVGCVMHEKATDVHVEDVGHKKNSD